MKKEIDQLKAELKQSCNDINTLENKLKIALSENEKHKNLVKNLNQEQKV